MWKKRLTARWWRASLIQSRSRDCEVLARLSTSPSFQSVCFAILDSIFDQFQRCHEKATESGSRVFEARRETNFSRLRRPANTKECLVHPICFRTRPLAHTDAKLMVFCPTFRFRFDPHHAQRQASTAASASSLVAIARTPEIAISAIHRPSSSCSNSILKFRCLL